MFNRIKSKFLQETYQPLKTPLVDANKAKKEAFNQRLQGAAHGSLNFDEADIPAGNAELVNAPGLLVQRKIIKDLKRELALFKNLSELKAAELEALEADPLQPETQGVKADIELCTHKIRELKYQLQEMKMLAARIGSGVTESAIILGSKIYRHYYDSSPAAEPFVMVGSVLVPFTEALHLFTQTTRYKQLGKELKNLKMLHDQANGAQKIEYERQIKLLHKQRKRSAESLVEGMAKTASSLASSSNTSIHRLSEFAPELISQTLLTGASAASALTGVLGAGVGLKELSKRDAEEIAIDKEIKEVKQQIDRSTGVLKEIMRMRLKSLQSQKSNTQISAVKSGIAVTAGFTGASSGLLGLTSLATAGAIGATIATAGVAAMALGGIAAGLGVSNLIYTNRHTIKNKGIYLKNEIDGKILKQQLKKTVQKVEKRADEWTSLQKQKKHAEESRMIFESLLPFEDEVRILKETGAHLKNLKKNLIFIRKEVDAQSSPELANSLTAEIDHLQALIHSNKSERKQLKEKLHSLIQIINAEAHQFKDAKHTLPTKIRSKQETLGMLMTKGDELEKEVKYAKVKRATIREAKNVSTLQDRLKETSEKDIETFLYNLKEQLRDEMKREAIQTFLLEKEIPVLSDDLYQAVMEYVLKKVTV